MIKEVKFVSYAIHQKTGSPDSIRVSYYCADGTKITEWVCPLHPGFAGEKAKKWIQKRISNNCNFNNIYELVSYAQKYFKTPNFIEFTVNGNFYNILKYDFNTPGTGMQSQTFSYSEDFYNKNKNHFDLLEIYTPEFTKENLIKNFRILCFKYHPDHGGTSQLFISLQDSKDILLDFLNKI